LLVIGFSLLAVISHANPQAPENILKNIPLLGATVLKNNHLKNGILIKSLGTSVQSIQGNREVFLITGVALNQNPVVVREIQVTGKVYNRDGREIEHQTIWVGNTMSPKIIRGMTVEDIPQLQELKPLKSFEVPPGDSIPFTIVFLKSTKNANEFTCEVVNAQGEI
jgi:hydroxymethylpyrimidine pyrophosphatase-like HAD family hydrolase